MADIYGMMMDGLASGERGVQRGKQSKLASLAGQAYTAPREQRQALLGQMAQVDPGAAYDAEKHFGGMDENGRKQLGQYAAAFLALPPDQKPQAYGELSRRAQALGIPAPMDYRPEYDEGLAKLAQAFGGQANGLPAGIQEFQYMANGLGDDESMRARRIALGLDPRASSAAIQYKMVQGEDGKTRLVAVDPREVGAQVIGGGASYGSGVPSPSQQPPNEVQDVVRMLAGQFGGQVSSLQRSPERNARVGGVPNSQHIAGTAGDVVVPQTQKAAFMQAARAQGLEAIDEGDHVHLELPPGAQRGANPFASRRPEDEAAAVEAAKQGTQLLYLPESERIKRDSAISQAIEIERGKAGVEVETKAGTKARDAQTTLDLLDEAETLLPNATGGAAGSARDTAAGVFGYATEGAKATAGLKLIAAELVAKVPRFEGPQSNIDVQFYREAAGDLANDKLPVETRMAALRVMRSLRKKYAGQQGAQPASDIDAILDKYR